MKVCIIGASGKLGRYMVRHALDRGYEVVGVCREKSVAKLDAFKGRITIIPGATNDCVVIDQAVAGCDGVLTVLVPWGVHNYSSGTAQAVLDYARPGARLIFSCGWHITRDGQDKYSRTLRIQEKFAVWIGRLTRLIDINDQIEACRRIFASDTLWTVVRGSDLEEGESQGLPAWSRHALDATTVHRRRALSYGLPRRHGSNFAAARLHSGQGCQRAKDPGAGLQRQSTPVLRRPAHVGNVARTARPHLRDGDRH